MDSIDQRARSENMRRIRSKDTLPEVEVRQLVRSLGYTGYRLHRKDLPGKPDIAWIGRKLAIFIHGCFWHAHGCKEGIRKPKSNKSYWLPKIERNRHRDTAHQAALKAIGWRVLIVWDCERRDKQSLSKKLLRFLS